MNLNDEMQGGDMELPRWWSHQVFDRTRLAENGVCDICGHEKVLIVSFFHHWDEKLEFASQLCQSCLYQGLERIKAASNETTTQIHQRQQLTEKQGQERLAPYRLADVPQDNILPVCLEISRFNNQGGGWISAGKANADVRLFAYGGGVRFEIRRDGASFLELWLTPAQTERLVKRLEEQLKAGDQALYLGVIMPRSPNLGVNIGVSWRNGLRMQFFTYEKIDRLYEFEVTPAIYRKLDFVAGEARVEWERLNRPKIRRANELERIETARFREHWID